MLTRNSRTHSLHGRTHVYSMRNKDEVVLQSFSLRHNVLALKYKSKTLYEEYIYAKKFLEHS